MTETVSRQYAKRHAHENREGIDAKKGLNVLRKVQHQDGTAKLQQHHFGFVVADVVGLGVYILEIIVRKLFL